MKKILIAAWIVATGAVAVESLAAPQANDAIKQVFVQLDECLAKRDANCVGELYVEDATYLASTGGATIVKGRPQIIKTIEKSLGSSDEKGPKIKHVVESVRMIDEAHAIVDSAIEFAGDAPPESYRDVSVMVLKDGKWLCQDVRFYVVRAEPSTKTEPIPSPKTEPVPPPAER